MGKTIIFCCVAALWACGPPPPFGKTLTLHDDYFQGTVTLEKVTQLDKYRLRIENSTNGEKDRIFTPYEVFAMESADVNHDGRTDICLGIIKPTPFDPVPKKRLFIFQIDQNYIRPLWLGSRLVHPLETFAVAHDSTGRVLIKTVERQNATQYYVNEYRWESFGMAFVRECHQGLPYETAVACLAQ